MCLYAGRKTGSVYKRFCFCILFILFVLTHASSPHENPGNSKDEFIHEYIRTGKNAFEFELVNEGDLMIGKAYILELTSQSWRGHDWRHWLTVFIPEEVRYDDSVLLIIIGGDNHPEPPPLYLPEIPFFTLCANHTGVPIAVLNQVPNQPLYGGLKSDALVAMTFDRFIREEDRDWPLLLPMTKASVRAMDAVQQFLAGHLGMEINKFVLCGGSKWGWTSYLAAAADERVKGIAPIVFDMLNIPRQVQRQKKSYGEYTDLLHDYSELDLMDSLLSDKGRELARMVDPYTYRESLDMPKLVILGTNDPYWTVDSANLYFFDLPEPRYLHYAPNTGHDLSLTSLPTLLAFLHSVFGENPMPEIQWKHAKSGSLSVRWEEENAEAQLLTARSPDRDFRDARWQSRVLKANEKTVTFHPEKPEQGYLAYFIRVSFPGIIHAGLPVILSTNITVLPEEFCYTAEGENPQEGSTGNR